MADLLSPPQHDSASRRAPPGPPPLPSDEAGPGSQQRHVTTIPGVESAPNKIDLAKRRLGTVLDDKWRLDALLGVGGMAAVYAATHRNGAQAAIKFLPFSLVTGPEVCQRLLREGHLANRIQHPGVVRVLDDHIDYESEYAYIVMDLLEGETARQRVERLGPLTPDEAIGLMIELVDCLRAAHAASVVHRDIKPENLFLTARGLKVLDFGIARALDANSSLTQTGTSLGTPAYMAPEQARGKQGDITSKSDLYSVGATLFFLLTGKTLHDGETAMELMVRAAWTPALPSRQICPELPDEVAQLIDRCCQFEPDARYTDAQALLDALTELAERAGLAFHLNPVVIAPASSSSQHSWPQRRPPAHSSGSLSAPRRQVAPEAATISDLPYLSRAPRWPLIGLGVLLAAAALWAWASRQDPLPPQLVNDLAAGQPPTPTAGAPSDAEQSDVDHRAGPAPAEGQRPEVAPVQGQAFDVAPHDPHGSGRGSVKTTTKPAAPRIPPKPAPSSPKSAEKPPSDSPQAGSEADRPNKIDYKHLRGKTAAPQ